MRRVSLFVLAAAAIAACTIVSAAAGTRPEPAANPSPGKTPSTHSTLPFPPPRIVSPDPAPRVPPQWVAIETFHYVWRKGAPAYTLIVQEDRANEDSTGADSPRLKIVGPNGQIEIVKLTGGLLTLVDSPPSYGNESPPGLHHPELVKDRLLPSHYIYLSPKLRTARGEPMLVAFGWTFEDLSEIRVIALDNAGIPRTVFFQDFFLIDEIRDVNADGVAEIIGYPSTSQEFYRCFDTYNPMAVFERPGGTSGFRYSLALSRQYNLRHHKGWAGPHYREDVGVVTCGKDRGTIRPSR